MRSFKDGNLLAALKKVLVDHGGFESQIRFNDEACYFFKETSAIYGCHNVLTPAEGVIQDLGVQIILNRCIEVKLPVLICMVYVLV